MGDFVKKKLKERHINRASLAKAMNVKPQAVASYIQSKSIANEVLIRMSTILQFDLYGMVVEEQVRLSSPRTKGAKASKAEESMVSEPAAHYQVPPSAGFQRSNTSVETGTGFNITISPRDYSLEDMVRVLRFLDGVPLKRNTGRTGG